MRCTGTVSWTSNTNGSWIVEICIWRSRIECCIRHESWRFIQVWQEPTFGDVDVTPRTVEFVSNIVWDMEDGTGRPWTKHLIVDRLNEPSDALVGCKVTRWLEWEALQVEHGCISSRIINRESFHDIGWIVLNEDLPIIDVGCVRMCPCHNWASGRFRNVRAQVPSHVTIHWKGIACSDGWNCCSSVRPCKIEPRSLCGKAFRTCECNQCIWGVTGHQRNWKIRITIRHRCLYEFGNIPIHPIGWSGSTEVAQRTDVRSNGTSTISTPVVCTIIGRVVESSRPGLQYRTYRHLHVGIRSRLSPHREFCIGDSGITWRWKLIERNLEQCARMITASQFTDLERCGCWMVLLTLNSTFSDPCVDKVRKL